jgi:diguanylate cyclase (GGDEF)-like protein
MVGSLQVHDGTRRYLVITRHLNARILSDLGGTFQIDNLHFTPAKSTIAVCRCTVRQGSCRISELAGAAPGAQAARAASSDIRQIVVLVSGLILLFILVSSVGLYKLARGESQARLVARTDWLSHLPNRRALIETLDRVRLRGDTDVKSVVFIDLDGFKDVNDIYGHSVGDDLIVAIAKTLNERVPPGGMLARMGGDEFAMTIGGDDAEAQATAFAVSVLDFLTTPIQLGERTIHIGASIGIASGTLIECTSSELFRRADIAMYHAKMSGKGRITHYDAELNSVRERKLAIENQIRSGLERDEFEVWYQPIVDARSQTMSSVEALVRWPRRPEGPLGPDTFIAIAETSGLIYKLGQFVLQRACEDLQPYGELKLSVNISPRNFAILPSKKKWPACWRAPVSRPTGCSLRLRSRMYWKIRSEPAWR